MNSRLQGRRNSKLRSPGKHVLAHRQPIATGRWEPVSWRETLCVLLPVLAAQQRAGHWAVTVFSVLGCCTSESDFEALGKDQADFQFDDYSTTTTISAGLPYHPLAVRPESIPHIRPRCCSLGYGSSHRDNAVRCTTAFAAPAHMQLLLKHRSNRAPPLPMP